MKFGSIVLQINKHRLTERFFDTTSHFQDDGHTVRPPFAIAYATGCPLAILTRVTSLAGSLFALQFLIHSTCSSSKLSSLLFVESDCSRFHHSIWNMFVWENYYRIPSNQYYQEVKIFDMSDQQLSFIVRSVMRTLLHLLFCAVSFSGKLSVNSVRNKFTLLWHWARLHERNITALCNVVEQLKSRKMEKAETILWFNKNDPPFYRAMLRRMWLCCNMSSVCPSVCPFVCDVQIPW